MKTDKSAVDSLEVSDLNVRVEGNGAIVTGVNRVKGRDAQGQALDVEPASPTHTSNAMGVGKCGLRKEPYFNSKTASYSWEAPDSSAPLTARVPA